MGGHGKEEVCLREMSYAVEMSYEVALVAGFSDEVRDREAGAGSVRVASTDQRRSRCADS